MAPNDVWQIDEGQEDYMFKLKYRRFAYVNQVVQCLSISPPDVNLLNKNQQFSLTYNR